MGRDIRGRKQTAGEKKTTREECMKAYDQIAMAQHKFQARQPGDTMPSREEQARTESPTVWRKAGLRDCQTLVSEIPLIKEDKEEEQDDSLHQNIEHTHILPVKEVFTGQAGGEDIFRANTFRGAQAQKQRYSHHWHHACHLVEQNEAWDAPRLVQEEIITVQE